MRGILIGWCQKLATRFSPGDKVTVVKTLYTGFYDVHGNHCEISPDEEGHVLIVDNKGDMRVFYERDNEVHKKWILCADLKYVSRKKATAGETLLVKLAPCGSSRLQVTHTQGFAKGDVIFVGGEKSVVKVQCETSIFLERPLRNTHYIGTPVQASATRESGNYSADSSRHVLTAVQDSPVFANMDGMMLTHRQREIHGAPLGFLDMVVDYGRGIFSGCSCDEAAKTFQRQAQHEVEQPPFVISSSSLWKPPSSAAVVQSTKSQILPIVAMREMGGSLIEDVLSECFHSGGLRLFVNNKFTK